MRNRTIATTTAAMLALVAFGLFGTADAGPNGQVYENTFTVEKVVVGPVPDGAVFEVEVSCETMADGLPDAGPATVPPTVTVEFDANGDPLGMNMISVPGGYECTAVETVTNGATVVYTCAASGPVMNPVAPPAFVQVSAQCIDDQTVVFGGANGTSASGDSAAPQLEVAGAEGTVTVTNTFEEPPPPTAPATAPATARAGVVAARPAFTG